MADLYTPFNTPMSIAPANSGGGLMSLSGIPRSNVLANQLDFGLGGMPDPNIAIPQVDMSPMQFNYNPSVLDTASSWFNSKFGDTLGSSKWWLGGKDGQGQTTNGAAMPIISAASGLMNAYMGMQQYGLYKDQFKFQKESFAKNFDAQRSSINSQLEDRQRARVASNAGAYQSVGDYMNKNGIK